MSDLTLGLELLFNLSNVTWLVIGLVAGFLVGVLPGFSGANAAAVILPFSIGLSLEGALLLIVGIYAGASFAGAVPAILLNVPGTAGAAATALDGFPMAQRGEGELAIGIARMASAAGGLIAIVTVLSLMGPVSRLALLFGSREMFVVALFGLLIIATVVGDNVWKGLTAGFLGLLISTMSVNPLTAQTRWTLGFIELYEGVPFVPALIGLFAFTEMFFWARRAREQAKGLEPDAAPLRASGEGFKGTVHGIRVALSYPRTIVRAALLGVAVGAIPGTGQAVGNFLSYGLAKRFSKEREQFGKGSREGIVASEACDTAVTAGTLVPTLTLGIPGSGTAAVMLAAMYMHGVQPGPRVMTTHGPEVYAVLWGLMLAAILILPLGILLASPLVAITRIKPGALVPSVIAVSAVGAFAIRNSMFDVGVAFVFGVLGVALRSGGYPVIPVVIALILGPMAERNFLRAMRIGRNDLTYFLGSTSARILWGLLLLTVAYSIFKWRQEKASGRTDSLAHKEIE